MNIRPAAEADIPTLARMAVEFEEYLISIDDTLQDKPPEVSTVENILRKGFGHEYHYFIVAEEGGQIIGFADMWAYPEYQHAGISGYLHNIYISPDHRGKGIGSAMVDDIIAECKRRECIAIHIPVLPKNTEAIEFYKKKGIDEVLYMMETRL